MSKPPITSLILGIVGAVIGGIVGFFIFKWVARQGFYAPIPGAFVGIGFGLAARRYHPMFGIISAILGLIAGLVAEWMTFRSEASLPDFVDAMRNESPITWVMIGLGVVLAYSFGAGRNTISSRPPEPRD